MSTLKFKMFNLNAKPLSREQMKNVTGGGGVATVKCYKCCPDDQCSSRPHVCPLSDCGPVR